MNPSALPGKSLPQSLLQSTAAAVEAAKAGDLSALREALAQRAQAMANASEHERAAALELGGAVLPLLTEIKRGIVLEYSRLGQIRAAFASPPRPASLDLRG
jgi:hypothetical protein